jgi:hypothetical protein
MAIQTACPACNAQYNLADHLEGKTVKCKGCQEPFVVGALTTKKAKTVGVAPAPSKKKSPPPEDDEIDTGRDDEEDDRSARQPTKKKKKKGKKRAKSGAPFWVFLAVGGGVLLLLLLGGIGLMYVLKGGAPSHTDPDANPATGILGDFVPRVGLPVVAPNVTEEAFDKLRTGMTEEEAIAVIGLPTKRKVGPDDPSRAPVITGPNVTVTDLVRLIWESGRNKIELGFDVNHKAFLGRAKFEDGQGGIRELLGNKYDQVNSGNDQVTWHWLANGQAEPPTHSSTLPPGPSKITWFKAVNAAGLGKTSEQIVQALGEQPTKKLGPQLLPDGKESADTWIWNNGSGYLKIYFDANGKVIRVKNRDLPGT